MLRDRFRDPQLAADDPAAIVSRIADGTETIVAPLRGDFPEAAIRIEEVNAYPGLHTSHDSEIVSLLRRSGAREGICKVAFGTEAGLFNRELGLAAAICGPGNMAQGHTADEYIELAQLRACDDLLFRLIETLRSGLHCRLS